MSKNLAHFWETGIDYTHDVRNCTVFRRSQILDNTIREFNNINNTPEWKAKIEKYICDQRELCEIHHGFEISFELTSNLLFGAGDGAAWETGFRFHPVLNTPFLPGSSTKGMISSFARAWASSIEEEMSKLTGVALPKAWVADRDPQLFGSKSDNDDAGSGSVGDYVFLDTILHGAIELKRDVRTPHKATGVVSVFFLTVAPGATATFFVMPTGRQTESLLHKQNEEIDDEAKAALIEQLTGRRDCDKKKLESWFENALRYFGAGARTKGGRGRMKILEPKDNGDTTKG